MFTTARSTCAATESANLKVAFLPDVVAHGRMTLLLECVAEEEFNLKVVSPQDVDKDFK